MKEDSIEDLKKKLDDQLALNAKLHKEVMEYVKAEEVLIAAGLISQAKVKQAHEIVQNFS